MINTILSKLGLGDGSLNASSDTRRKYIRHTGVTADVIVGSRSYSVRDWSMGGILFETLPDSRMIAGDQVNLTLKFRFPDDVVTVEQTGRVIRTGRRGVAAEFVAVNSDARRKFERIIDGLHTEEFLQSQVA